MRDIDPYGTLTGQSHDVLAYAYNRLRNNDNGNILSFVKIADAYSRSGRYVLLHSLLVNHTKYWVVSLPFNDNN